MRFGALCQHLSEESSRYTEYDFEILEVTNDNTFLVGNVETEKFYAGEIGSFLVVSYQEACELVRERLTEDIEFYMNSEIAEKLQQDHPDIWNVIDQQRWVENYMVELAANSSFGEVLAQYDSEEHEVNYDGRWYLIYQLEDCL